MSTKSNVINSQTSGRAFSHAIVIGSSIAGLTAARVLTDHFDRVTIIERDHLFDTPEFRRGVPQTRHTHILPLRGQSILEQQFPGLADELVANGAASIGGGSEMAFFIAGGWHEVRHHSAVVSMTCSRPLLESTIYRRLANHPKVHIVQGYEVVGLSVGEGGRHVTGVDVRRRHALSLREVNLAADLVVDASGRGSQAPQWLVSLGFTPPPEKTVNAFAGYATRLYRRPAQLSHSWKTLYIRPTPPHNSRGGLVIPIEGDRWQVTLIGMARDYPPTEEAGFLSFARSLPTPQLYEAIKEAQPLTKPYGYRQVENRARQYEKLPFYLEGFLVCGDAAFALNPVYAQGMTAAALGSQALDRCLKEQRQLGEIAGLARAFQTQLSQAVVGLWHLATREDRRWPATEVSERSELTVRQRRPHLVRPPQPLSAGPAMARLS